MTREYVFPLLDRLSGEYGEERVSLLLRYQIESVLEGAERVIKEAGKRGERVS